MTAPKLKWVISYLNDDAKTECIEFATLDIGQDVEIQCFGDYLPRRDEANPLEHDNVEEWIATIRNTETKAEMTLWEDTSFEACKGFVERWLRNIAIQGHHLI